MNKGHGRIETRRCWSIPAVEELDYVDENRLWAGLNSVVMVKSERKVGEKVSVETRYCISSLKGSARKPLEAIRTHW